MSSTNTRFLSEMLRNQYVGRLNEVIKEADVFDDEGNMILSPDLKVKHRDSGYEYTIDHVEGDTDNEIQIYLRSPESPRVHPAPEEKSLLGEPRQEDILGEQDPAANIEEELPSEDQEDVIFVINQQEFEKEYEVD